ncbi:MAG: hypothetical protein IPF65_02600 [Polaromonas sp.]|jgi:hypothetical protein|nr:hypothetical protein [Polaromonas sp.]
MERYKNFSGTSGIAAFEIDTGSIKVQFKDGAVYLYTTQSAGTSTLEQMKQLAISGSGLNSYIMTNAKKSYSAKLR